MLPLPNCFSIVDTATSIALSRAGSRSRIATGESLSTALSTALSALSNLVSLFSVVVVAMSSFSGVSCQLEASAARDLRTYVEPSPPRRLS